MEQLKAFVGHSFREDDKKVNHTFFNYFDSLKDAIGLEWDHADKAEGKALSKKVKDKMEGKNLFIGILTKRDYRIKTDKLKNSLISKRKCVSETDCVWGASEWIIQESGYALAKSMKLLLLIENGVYISAGLQGDIEYIPFSRENCELCFIKINEMLGSLLPYKTSGIPITDKTVSPAHVEKKVEEKEKTDDEQIPEKARSTTFFQSYRSLHEFVITKKNSAKAKTELNKVIDSFKGDEIFNELYWKSIFHRMKCNAGDPDGFVELKKLSEANPNNPLPLSCLGDAHKKYGNLSEAAHQYLKASELEQGKDNQIELIGQAAECYALDENSPQAYDILLKKFSESKLDSSQYHNLYTKLAKIAQIAKYDNLFTAFAEKALEYSPADVDTRFSLAYRYSEIDNSATAFHHYKILCRSNPNGTNWNNIGVAYRELGMKYKSISSYREASDKYKETLSMANLAYDYINEGFLSNAADILEKARSEKNYHKNIDAAMTKIHEVKETEENLEKEILRNIERERKFRVKFAEAYALPFKVNIDGEWQTLHGKILLQVEGERISGNYEISPPAPPAIEKHAGLISSTLARLSLGAEDFKKRMLRLEGKIYNGAIDYKLIISTEYDSLLAPAETTYEGIMCVAKDESIIEAMERVKDEKELRFYEMKRVQGSSNPLPKVPRA